MKKKGRSLTFKRIGILAAFILAAGCLCAATIEVTEPGNYDILWLNGMPQTIRWTQDGALPTTGKVRIGLRNEASTTEIMPIVLKAPNNGAYSWTVPLNIAMSKYVVRVKLLGMNAIDDSVPFSIRPRLRVTNPPYKGDVVKPGPTTITWVWDGTVPVSEVSIYIRDRKNTYPQRDIAFNLPVTGPCPWTVPMDLPTGEYVMYLNVPGVKVIYSSLFNIVLPRALIPVKVKK
jgi:hypothetical protein